ncbi:hypothetical protein BROSI_A3665 [Candidatus Brocadia sinica JPN1]|uniref:Uncharacterized protein n=1 Tax=Candidatus Brocadia sinica JPN1 TaxID=1197129 RepID=A0ABQ0K1Z7_9BACT|nr:hypothetical protein BROSI_A3665 [Candidatus Brocadia sinica JPN1]
MAICIDNPDPNESEGKCRRGFILAFIAGKQTERISGTWYRQNIFLKTQNKAEN